MQGLAAVVGALEGEGLEGEADGARVGGATTYARQSGSERLRRGVRICESLVMRITYFR